LTDKKKVLLIGWNPDVTDYSKWPELTHEKLSSALEADRASLDAQGYDASWCFLVDAETAADTVTQTLEAASYDCVLIGAGVRLDPGAFNVFERLINAIHVTAPSAKICFNTTLSDIAESVKRWV
jgi:hypothetical protein